MDMTYIIKEYYTYKRTNDKKLFAKEARKFFDSLQDVTLSDMDISFLAFIANEAGLSGYCDILRSKSKGDGGIFKCMELIALGGLFEDENLVKNDKNLNRYKKKIEATLF